jgi:hypothetical protein
MTSTKDNRIIIKDASAPATAYFQPLVEMCSECRLAWFGNYGSFFLPISVGVRKPVLENRLIIAVKERKQLKE